MEDKNTRLAEAEGSGRVEYKRSCLWPLETDALKVQGVLVRLANGNPEAGALVHLGREDNRTVVGLVDKDLQPVTDPRKLKAAEQKLVQIAERLDPPMQIRWNEYKMAGVQTIVIEVPGRITGGWYQDENGVALVGSGSHPTIARQELLQRWAREGVVPDYALQVAGKLQVLRFDLEDIRQHAEQLRGGADAERYYYRLNVPALKTSISELSAVTRVPDSLMYALSSVAETATRINGMLEQAATRRDPTGGYGQQLSIQQLVQTNGFTLVEDCRRCLEELRKLEP